MDDFRTKLEIIKTIGGSTEQLDRELEQNDQYRLEYRSEGMEMRPAAIPAITGIHERAGRRSALTLEKSARFSSCADVVQESQSR